MKNYKEIAIGFMVVALGSFMFALICYINFQKAQRGDLNLDGKVDIEDLSIMADNFEEVE